MHNTPETKATCRLCGDVCGSDENWDLWNFDNVVGKKEMMESLCVGHLRQFAASVARSLSARGCERPGLTYQYSLTANDLNKWIAKKIEQLALQQLYGNGIHRCEVISKVHVRCIKFANRLFNGHHVCGTHAYRLGCTPAYGRALAKPTRVYHFDNTKNNSIARVESAIRNFLGNA